MRSEKDRTLNKRNREWKHFCKIAKEENLKLTFKNGKIIKTWRSLFYSVFDDCKFGYFLVRRFGLGNTVLINYTVQMTDLYNRFLICRKWLLIMYTAVSFWLLFFFFFLLILFLSPKKTSINAVIGNEWKKLKFFYYLAILSDCNYWSLNRMAMKVVYKSHYISEFKLSWYRFTTDYTSFWMTILTLFWVGHNSYFCWFCLSIICRFFFILRKNIQILNHIHGFSF